MPEGAPGNPGAGRAAPPAGMARMRKVREMQAKLHRWAGEDPSRRFGDLCNLVYDLEFLAEAWFRVKANTGSRTPGIDKATVAEIENRIGVGVFLEQIRGLLKSGEFWPVPVRQVMIPKKSGKLRKLGIPTVADRVVQASLKLVLEPIFEADFQPCSYGFRPGRRAHDAIAEIHHLASEPSNYQWVFETDIKACFDEISHTALMNRVRARIKDKRVCALVKAFLKAGVMTASGDREETLTGTPQGGILSPLLANIALCALDDYFTRQWQAEMGRKQRERRRRNGEGNWKLIRYAGDLVLMVDGERRHAEALREQVAAVLAPLGLRLADEKTRVVHIGEGFDFLGFTIRRMRKRGTAKRYVYTRPSRKSVQAAKDKVKAKTYRSTRHMEPGTLIISLNRLLAGWAAYFRHGVSKRIFTSIDEYTWNRIMRWTRAKYATKTGPLSMKEFRRRFCVPGTWRIAHGGVKFTGASSVPVTRYRYRGSNIPAPFTPQPAPAATR
ncbi:MAG: group II intron reverse transcriptase/maturase [Streptosporangiaceae bacterium]|nr:group II intron reverse transcriptase/maturase [Streptosporangiaceae bacterium]